MVFVSVKIIQDKLNTSIGQFLFIIFTVCKMLMTLYEKVVPNVCLKLGELKLTVKS